VGYRRPPPVRVTGDIEVMVTTGIIYWLEIRVPLISGQPGEGVAFQQHEAGLKLGRQLIDQLPPGARREAERRIAAARRRVSTATNAKRGKSHGNQGEAGDPPGP
jgi:hypothetical protein